MASHGTQDELRDIAPQRELLPYPTEQQDEKCFIVFLVPDAAPGIKPEYLFIEGSYDSIVEGPIVHRGTWKKARKNMLILISGGKSSKYLYV